MKCAYCKKEILKHQKRITRRDTHYNEKVYHEECYEVLADKLMNKIQSGK